MDNYYCQQKCGEVDFSIEEWNSSFKHCLDNNLSDEETSLILEGEPCKKQCFDCMVVVGETRKKNKLLRKSILQNEV